MSLYYAGLFWHLPEFDFKRIHEIRKSMYKEQTNKKIREIIKILIKLQKEKEALDKESCNNSNLDTSNQTEYPP